MIAHALFFLRVTFLLENATLAFFDMDFGYAGELEHFAFHDDPLFYRLGCAGNDSHHPHCTYST